MTPEGKIKKMVTERLKLLGKDCWRFMPVQSGFGTPALDYLICIKGVFVAIETKAPGHKPTPLQEVTANQIRLAGGLVFVVDSKETLDAAMATIMLVTETGR